MIEIRVRESENKIIDLGKLELIPYDANFDVYDDEVGVETFKLFNKQKNDFVSDDIFIGYTIPKDFPGFVVCRSINNDYLLMTENGEYIHRVFPEEAEELKLFLTRIARNVSLLSEIKCLDFFANKEVKKELFKLHGFLNKKRIEKAIKEESKHIGPTCVMSDLEKTYMENVYRKKERLVKHKQIKEHRENKEKSI